MDLKQHTALARLLQPSASSNFDYETLEPEHRDALRKHVSVIHGQAATARQSVFEIGRRLIESKALLPHGRWGEWLKLEFDWSERSAQRYIRLVEVFGDKSDSLSGMPITAQHALASPSTSPEVRNEILARHAGGERITEAVVRREAAKRSRPDLRVVQSDEEADRATRLRQVKAAEKNRAEEHARQVAEKIASYLSQEERAEVRDASYGIDPRTLGEALKKALSPGTAPRSEYSL